MADGDEEVGKTVVKGPPGPRTRTVDAPIGLFSNFPEFVSDGVIGGNYNTEMIRIVFYADKPLLNGAEVQTHRVQVATAAMRKSNLRKMIADLTAFADHVDKYQAELAEKQRQKKTGQ